MRSLFVAGTEAGVGKTVVAAALARAAAAAGALPAYYCPFTTDDVEDMLVPQMSLQGVLKQDPGKRYMLIPVNCETSYQFNAPVSPYVGMRGSAESVDVSQVLKMISRLRRNARRIFERSASSAASLPGGPWEIPETPLGNAVIVEGTGGAMTPIRRDYCVADLIRDAAMPAVIVTTNRIGALNLSVMTAAACRDRGAAPLGFVVNCIDPDGYDPGRLAEDIAEVTGVPVLAVLRAHGTPVPPPRKGSMFGKREAVLRTGEGLADMPEGVQRSCAAATAVHESGALDGLARMMLEGEVRGGGGGAGGGAGGPGRRRRRRRGP